MRRIPQFFAAFVLLLAASVCSSQDPDKIKIGGPVLAAVGQELRLPVVGLVSPDTTTPEGLKPVVVWANKITGVIDSPPDAMAAVDREFALSLLGGVKVYLTFTADKPGLYVIVLSDGNTGRLTTKRINVGGVVVDPNKPPPVVDPNTKVTAVTYVYEKDQAPVPRPVQGALNKLHAAGGGVVASLFEDDAVTGLGTVPKQYQVPLKAAREAGLPCLVVTAGDTVLRVLKAPTTEAEVLEAAK
jgi:hypothetical protein